MKLRIKFDLWQFVTVVYILMFLLLTSSADAAVRIEVVEARVTSEKSLPPMVKERMEESVAAIGKQLILGHNLPITEDWKKHQESTIHLVFNKILVGYTVKQVTIQCYGTEAIINVNLLPWTDTIQNIQVNTEIEGMPEELKHLVMEDLNYVKGVFMDGLKGLPIAATDWTNGILKRRLNKFMEESLPEFRVDFDVKIRNESNISTAIVDMTVYPKLPVVRTISLSMLSDTMPNVALVTHRTFMEDKVNVLIGVPVAFIERHKEDIEKMLAKPLDEHTDFRVLKIKSNVTLTAAEQMAVMIRSDSSRYRMRASGWVDIGRDERATDDILLRMHIGRKISSVDETFFQIDVKPQEMKWNWAFGYSRNIFKNTSAALRYDFTDDDLIVDLEYEFFKNWLLRYEHKFDDDRKEAAIRYKISDFLGVEYVVDQRESWLRFIGNF